MKKAGKNPNKERYQRLRMLPWRQIWDVEVAAFNAAAPDVRASLVAVVRAAAVVFLESGDPADRGALVAWLRSLLKDPEEIIRRYAVAALPKIGADESDESELLALLGSSTTEREKKFLGRSLDKIGGRMTLQKLEGSSAPLPLSEQRVRASVVRNAEPGAVALNRSLSLPPSLLVRLRGRRGLEEIVCDEVVNSLDASRIFRLVSVDPGSVTLAARAPFSLAEVMSLRCFGTAAIVLGCVPPEDPDQLARLIVSGEARKVMRAWTTGTPRYRLEFIGRGHRRGLVREAVSRAFAICPDVLNDARSALWEIGVYPQGKVDAVELRPRLVPDPRFSYRRQDVPAASHPPMAACMARLSGSSGLDVVWDPFCGSGLELIERARLGGVRRIIGTDRSQEAVAIARANYLSAGFSAPAEFICSDFRDFAESPLGGRESLTQIITNPPLGRRVPIANMPGLIRSLFAAADFLLRPGGSLVFANPLRMTSPWPSLRLISSRVVDFGGFDCRLEQYGKSRPAGRPGGASRIRPGRRTSS